MTIQLPYDIPACWGVSTRNTERNGKRNEEHTEYIYANVEGITNTPFIYQFCGHENKKDQCVIPRKEQTKADSEYACRAVTALISSFQQGENDPNLIARVTAIGRRMKVPAFFIYHQPYDYERNHTVDFTVVQPDGTTTINKGVLWRSGFLSALLDTQVAHEDSAHNCYIDVPPNHFDWIDGLGDAPLSTSNSLNKGKGYDLTLSKALRFIPGVRHLDVDACVTCTKCNQPIHLIEASSDGYSRGKQSTKSKTAAMTLKLGAALNIPTMKLLHAHSVTVDDRSGCDIITWRPGQKWDKEGKPETTTGRPIDMQDVLEIFDEIVALHKKDCRG